MADSTVAPRRTDQGFTLIELMVVLLILAILLAIAIPTFLGVTASAKDRSAQANLNTALTSVQSIYQSQSQSYLGPTAPTPAALATALTTANPGLTYTTTNSATINTISVGASTDGAGLVLAAYAPSTHNCWYLIENPSTPTPISNAPWTGTATATGSTAAGFLVVPSALGLTYAVVKADSTATDCSAVSPKLTAPGLYKTSTQAFPT